MTWTFHFDTNDTTRLLSGSQEVTEKVVTPALSGQLDFFTS